MEYDDQPENVIEICTGPQCSVSGAPAALLEIEDLAMEAENGFRLKEEGCRDFCTMGPNVYFIGSHFSKVQTPEDCERIAKEIGMLAHEDDLDSSLSTVGKMMRRKANRKRWQLLRSIARQKSAGIKKTEKWKRELQEVHDLELRAAESSDISPKLNERADRRLKRLLQYVDDT